MYNLQDIKRVIGPFDSGFRDSTGNTVIQHFYWECGCYARRKLHDEPVEASFCRDHESDALRRLQKVR